VKLSELAADVAVRDRINWNDVEVSGVETDSRRVKRGSCFVAVAGSAADGHAFVGEAERAGAAALVVSRPVASPLPALVVEDTALAAALVARRFYGDPASKIVLAGITGTNGKTSSAFLLRSVLETDGRACCIIGTVGYGSGDSLVSAGNTTPGAVDLHRMMAEFVERGCRSVVMEVSSHAAQQNRIAGLEFDVGAFTNATRDHLDYHGTFERYVEAKEIFVRTLDAPGRRKRPGTLAWNADDPAVAAVAGRFAGPNVSFGLETPADVRAERIEATLRATNFDLVVGASRERLSLSLLGMFSIYNALTAAAAAHALGVGLPAIKRGLEGVRAVPGRFQVVASGAGPTAIVDYAHTPDALEKLLRFCRELRPKRVITVFGCGGDRDRGKRPIMGAIAAALSDVVYVTDDNPRTEDPDRIVKEVLDGVGPAAAAVVRVVRDRREAIQEAIREGREGDLVVIAGKGHENEQILHGRRVPFNDAAEAASALAAAEARREG
jgi:UDP-N-acetylmuramoyl-L-alanyl-D-glutamate--2,6-diaminopimelate ligase